MDAKNQKMWNTFNSKASDEAEGNAKMAMVEELVKSASSLLLLIRDTFPTYTLHDERHSKNVIALMVDLLGEEIEKLTALEAAILILSAYFHDVGMVFTPEEKEKIKTSPDHNFDKFKKDHAEVSVEIQKTGEISDDTMEWYCRWLHPERVHIYLDDIGDEKMMWGVTSLKECLTNVCRSHGCDIGELYQDEFNKEFLGKADLKFCSILLRLADIMDFDHTRSPEDIYNYLGLKTLRNKPAETSDLEWRKHLCSDGFVFEQFHKGGHDVKFIAQPKHPAVEHDVRGFLDEIETEFLKCSKMLNNCSHRWQDFRLPVRINRDDIRGKNYKYGEYRFTLEQNKVLDIFMGENLYDDPYIFVRELLQNAIDTVRFREFYEKSRHNPDYKPLIDVKSWYDHENYLWIRFDDNGMGMTEEKIRKFLLKVGQSYYTSPVFEADKLEFRSSETEDFTPISRFGIGLLSCFIAGDQVEISTNSGDAGKSIRMSIEGLHNFYVLHTEEGHHKPKPMPNEGSPEHTYRTNRGTSIAVRLDPKKEKTVFDLANILDRIILFPLVPIRYKGTIIGEWQNRYVEKPWMDDVLSVELDDNQIDRIKSFLEDDDFEKIELKIIPLDLTANSSSPDLRGQLLIGQMHVSHSGNFNFSTFDLDPIKFCLKRDCSLEIEMYKYLEKGEIESETIDIYQFKDALNDNVKSVLKLMNLKGGGIGSSGYLSGSHNGIKISSSRNIDFINIGMLGWTIGLLALRDSLRPDLSISRDIIKGYSWEIQAHTTLSLFKAAINYRKDHPFRIYSFFPSSMISNKFILGDIQQKISEYWKDIPMFQTDRGVLNLKELIEKITMESTDNVVNVSRCTYGITE